MSLNRDYILNEARVFLYANDSSGTQLDESFDISNYPIQLLETSLNINGTGIGDFQVEIDSHLGNIFDSIVFNIDTSGYNSIRWIPNNLFLAPGDKLNFYWDNSGLSQWGLQLSYQYAGSYTSCL